MLFLCSFFFFIIVFTPFLLSLVLSFVSDALSNAGYRVSYDGEKVVLKNDNSWRAVADVVISSDEARDIAARSSVLAVDARNRHPSHVVARLLQVIRPCVSSPDLYARIVQLWSDAFTGLLPLLRELRMENVKMFLTGRGDFVPDWCRRAVKLISDHQTAITFYSHLLLHWNDCLRHSASLSISPFALLTPAHFGQDADESAWRFLRRWLTRLTTFNGGHSAAALASPSAVQLVQRSLMLFALRWLRGAELWKGADAGVVAAPPADFDALLALLARLHAFYLPDSAARQQQQVTTSVRVRPLVSQAALDRFVLDQRAAATDLESDMPSCEELLLALRSCQHEHKRARFDKEKDDIEARLLLALATTDNTKLK
jgi:hypothetical protein